MNEIKYLYQEICPSSTIFVVYAMNTAKAFLTKLDGALTILSVVNKPIKFISTGENLSIQKEWLKIISTKKIFCTN